MRWAVIAIGPASLAGGLGLLGTGRVGVNIFPSGDQSEVDITLTMPSASTIDTTDAVVKQLEQRLTAYPEVRAAYSAVGGGSGAGGDSAQVFALLVPTTDRQRSSTALADVLRLELGKGIPGATIRAGVPNAFGFGQRCPTRGPTTPARTGRAGHPPPRASDGPAEGGLTVTNSLREPGLCL
jgi:HAE1 family hydrophobic/amphiphilic exporter-1